MDMTLDELEAEALRSELRRVLASHDVVASLEVLSDDENLQLWVAEAERRDGAWESTGQPGDPAEQVFGATSHQIPRHFVNLEWRRGNDPVHRGTQAHGHEVAAIHKSLPRTRAGSGP